LSNPYFYTKTRADPKRLHARVSEIEEELLAALERWEAIEARS
jgi:ATP-binding cassette subfamily F protein uup